MYYGVSKFSKSNTLVIENLHTHTLVYITGGDRKRDRQLESPVIYLYI